MRDDMLLSHLVAHRKSICALHIVDGRQRWSHLQTSAAIETKPLCKQDGVSHRREAGLYIDLHDSRHARILRRYVAIDAHCVQWHVKFTRRQVVNGSFAVPSAPVGSALALSVDALAMARAGSGTRTSRAGWWGRALGLEEGDSQGGVEVVDDSGIMIYNENMPPV